jgi:hypothetical protein
MVAPAPKVVAPMIAPKVAGVNGSNDVENVENIANAGNNPNPIPNTNPMPNAEVNAEVNDNNVNKPTIANQKAAIAISNYNRTLKNLIRLRSMMTHKKTYNGGANRFINRRRW